ncbi:MAG: ADP-ribosylation family protein, partial [Planctomycetota bacterium]
MDDRAPGVAPLYDTSSLSPREQERAAQMRDLYGFAFPAELLQFWRWHQGLSQAQQDAFGRTLGLAPVGPFDVLAGKFDGVELAYPAVLNWRFAGDPPEFVTVFLGEDGRRVGLWFDDHRRLSPVVASYYRDDREITVCGDTLFGATRQWMAWCDEGLVEVMEDDPGEKDEYAARRAALADLLACLPPSEKRAARPRAHETGDGIGVAPAAVGGDAATAALVRGRRLWTENPREAGPLLGEAYRLADRPFLARIVSTYMQHPDLPRVTVYDIAPGSYFSLADAMANPARVRILGLGNAGLKTLPDLSALTGLAELTLHGNQLTDLPASLLACKGLKRINLFRNPLARVPEVLYQLPALEQVCLTGPTAKSPFSAKIGTLPTKPTQAIVSDAMPAFDDFMGRIEIARDARI